MPGLRGDRRRRERLPPEDVGGPHGYALFPEIIGNRHHEQYEDMMRWIGGVFDPKGFDLNRLSRDWTGKVQRRDGADRTRKLLSAEGQTCIQPPSDRS